MTASDEANEAITLAPLPLARRGQLRNALASAGLPHTDITEEGRSFFAGEHREVFVLHRGHVPAFVQDYNPRRTSGRIIGAP